MKKFIGITTGDGQGNAISPPNSTHIFGHVTFNPVTDNAM
jgi:hypothetical protein